MSLRIGVDIGGTFTDLILVDEAGAVFRVGKVLTTPADPARAVERGLKDLLAATGAPAAQVSHVV
ncbi:MAG TPA: hydantoinase/oxoprolinase N-terminal domain-containing protein, partial [Candidatus Methylomirabilis sp.]